MRNIRSCTNQSKPQRTISGKIRKERRTYTHTFCTDTFRTNKVQRLEFQYSQILRVLDKACTDYGITYHGCCVFLDNIPLDVFLQRRLNVKSVTAVQTETSLKCHVQCTTHMGVVVSATIFLVGCLTNSGVGTDTPILVSAHPELNTC